MTKLNIAIALAIVLLGLYVGNEYLRDAGLFFIEPLRDPLVFISGVVGLTAVILAVWQIKSRKKAKLPAIGWVVALRYAILALGVVLILEVVFAIWLGWKFEEQCNDLKAFPFRLAPGCPG